jgi:8-oxo-dGTP pyrophosphatase MutT (NUDIX family)
MLPKSLKSALSQLRQRLSGKPRYVKVLIHDQARVLQTHYVRVDQWDIPGGTIEPNETPLEAAARELRERTGYTIEPQKLKLIQTEKNTVFYEGSVNNIVKVAEPGELGGYKTEIRWSQHHC